MATVQGAEIMPELPGMPMSFAHAASGEGPALAGPLSPERF